MTMSAAITAAGGCFYAQYFLFIDAGIAYGPWISVEALLAPIIGGIGTVFGPLLGALVVQDAGRTDQARDRRCAGPRPRDLRRRADRWSWRSRRAASRALRRPARAVFARGTAGSAAMAEPLLRVENVSQPLRRPAGASTRASFTAEAGRITALIGPNGAGKTTLFSIITGFLRAERRAACVYDGDDITGEPPHRLARRGIARTFQIVQPFAGLTVRENIAVGAHLSPARARAMRSPPPSEVAQRVGLGACSTGRPRASPSPAASGSSSRARSRSSRSFCCSTRCWPGLNPSEIRDMVPVIRAHPRPRHHHRDDRARDAGGDEPRRACVRAGRGPHHRRGRAAGDRRRSARRRSLSRPRRCRAHDAAGGAHG